MPAVNDCSFVILGATGDLTRRKLVPALYQLVARGQLERFAIIGVANSATTAVDILDRARPFIKAIDETVWQKLLDAFVYYQMDFYDAKAYRGLGTLLRQVQEQRDLTPNQIFYFATMPQHFATITKHLAHHGIVHQKAGKQKMGYHSGEHPSTPVDGNETDVSSSPRFVPSRSLGEGWSRMVYEKPFGSDVHSAKLINQAISRVFDESQVYRIDHYLGKELVGNIALLRFTNRVFEPLWNRDHIAQITIELAETLGVEGRGAFYDSVGALNDMMQNHMLQMLALVSMEAPERLTADFIRGAKARVLSKVQVKDALMGQYAGYHDEPQVEPGSTTETFAALRVAIDNTRWRGVPFYLVTGKKLARKKVTIRVVFKQVRCLLDFCPSDPNTLEINIDPDQGIVLNLNAKVPGVANEVVRVPMELCHTGLTGPNTPEAYEVLLADVLKGDQCAFVRGDEIIRSWQIIQQAKELQAALMVYQPGGAGPDISLLMPHETKE